MQTATPTLQYELPELPYAHHALEPHIDARTMAIHHDLHHRAYVEKLNKALEGHGPLAAKPITELIADLDSVPEQIRDAVRNNGGGHANHSLFWTILGPKAATGPSEKFVEAIKEKFGGFASMMEQFEQAAMRRFGSGWAWLCVDTAGQLSVTSTPNQDNPLMASCVDDPGTPILGCDVWEHAYYLKYQNKRAEYLKAFWNVVNWKTASDRYADALK